MSASAPSLRPDAARLRRAGTILAAAAALAFVGCGPPAPPPPSSGWAPGADDVAVTPAQGEFVHGRSEYLTPWHGVDPSQLASDPPALLGDDRDACFTRVPFRLAVPLGPADGPRRLTTAVRRPDPHPADPVHAEVFWQAADAEPRSLAQVRLDPRPDVVSEAWTQLDAALPAAAGTLILVARDPRPLGNRGPATELAWEAPVVAAADDGRLPDVLLITVDTLRADALEAAPGLRELLATGRQWPAAVSPSNWTLPSYASLFTGRPADEHQAGRGPFTPQATGQAENRGLSAVDARLPLLAERFRAAGYATGMVHQNPLLESWTGLNRGFERYARAGDDSEDVLALGSAWWQRHAGRPRFLVLHFMAPHLPYRVGPAPDPLEPLPVARFFAEDHTPEARAAFFDLAADARARVRARYLAEVTRLDAALTPWLRARLDEAGADLLLAFHSDHGEEFWEAGSFEHGHSFVDAVVRVPLALIRPGVLAPERHPGAVPAEGLSGSLLQAAGLPDALRAGFPTLDAPPEVFASSMPLYRAPHGGRRFTPLGEEWLPFDPARGSGGNGAPISERKRRMLAELGYLAEQDARD